MAQPPRKRPPSVSLLRPVAEVAPRLALPWVVQLRYGLLAGEVITIVVAVFAFHILLPWQLVFPLSITGASNVLLGRLETVSPERLHRLLGFVFCLDTLCLTAALSLCGGPSNPFSTLYLVQITVSAVVLDRTWTWILGGLSTLCFGLVFWIHRPLPALASHHEGGLSTHLIGMWIAFAIAAVLTAFFIGKLSEALREREREVLALEQEVARSERLASLVTLAAGAAHELGTPLASIAVAAKELERYSSQVSPDPAVHEDACFIRSEVERCRAILQQMAARGAETRGESPVPIDLGSILEKAASAFPAPERARIELAATDDTYLLPVDATVQALAALLKNAFDASLPGQPVILQAEPCSTGVRFQITDRGTGMPPEVLRRVAEPFFTTKDPGRGMGLGVFLVRLFAERMGGSLAYQSEMGKGSTAVLTIPAIHPREQVYGNGAR